MPLSKIVIVFLIVLWVGCCFSFKTWERNIIQGDTFSYYVYLPALFIKHDIKLKFIDNEKQSFYNNLWYSTSLLGIRFTKMGIGVAILHSPFFLLADVYAKAFHYLDDGFSVPYQIFLCLSSIFYASLALIFLRKSLLYFFSDFITAVTLFCIVLGTNLFYYTTLSPGMSHPFSFFLFALLIYCTVRWYRTPTITLSILLGISAGLIIETRPVNILILLVPLLYGINKREDFLNRVSFVKKNYKYIIACIIAGLISVSPQIIYWKIISGHWIYYSYTDEHFFFNHPHIIEGLVGFRKGWLLYTPLMCFALIGIPFLRKRGKEFFLSTSIFLILNVYVVLSWWCWWYGGSFGGRSFIESYALLAFPLASFFAFATNQRAWIKRIIIVTTSLLIVLSCFQTYQYNETILHYDSMTQKAYWAIFGRLKFPTNYNQLIKEPDYSNSKKYGKEPTR
jgi:hypothetical protein